MPPKRNKPIQNPVYTGREWVLDVPAQPLLLNANDRYKHWAVAAQRTASLRAVGAWLARQQKIPPIGKAHIVLELWFPDRRKRDPANWAATAKALVDGLRDAGVLADDDAERVVGPDCRLVGRGGTGIRARLRIKEVT